MLFIQSFLIINLFFIILSLLPHFKLKEKQSTYLSFVLNLSFYLIITVFAYSIIKSSFNTISIIGIPPILMLYIVYKEKLELRFKISRFELKALFYLLIVVNAIFILKAIPLFQNAGDFIKASHGDYRFYAKVSLFLNEYGIESFYINPNHANITPYHYFELWLNSLLSEFNVNIYGNLMLVTYPILLTFCFILSFALVYGLVSFNKAIIFSFVVIFVQLFFSHIAYANIPFLMSASTFAQNPWFYQKLTVLYFMFLLSLNFYRHSKLDSFLLIISIFPSIYGTTIFGVLGILIGSVILKLFFKSLIKWNTLLVLICSIISFKIFYQFNNYQNDLMPIISFQYLKTVINICGGTVILFMIITVPFLFFYKFETLKSVWSSIKMNYEVVFVLLFGSILALLAWSLLHVQLDSVQVFSNFINPVLCIAIALMLVLFIDYRISIFITLMLIGVNYMKYLDYHTLEHVAEKREIFTKNIKGGYFKKQTDYMSTFNINPNFAMPLSDLFILNSNVKMIDISMVDVNLKNHPNEMPLLNALKYNDLYNYSKSERLGGLNAKVGFIKKNKIQFLICPDLEMIDSKLIDLFKFKKVIEGYNVFYN